jgi:predicted ATPase/class 3 adenylate cyclase
MRQDVAVALTSGVVTFLFTDIEGSTAMLSRLGTDAYAALLAEHHRLVRVALTAHGGSEVATQGDGFFALFTTPRSCAQAAVDVQRSLAGASWPAGEQVRVRMGIHCGEATLTAAGPIGIEVHRAARLAAVGHGGQLLVSETAAPLLRDALPDGASLLDLGQYRLKDLSRAEHIFQLAAEGLNVDFPPLRSLDNPELEHNLPVQLTSFIGREHELGEVRRLVGESRLVTVVGPGGSGKTRLALQVAADLLDGSEDGVWVADLSAIDADEHVVPEVARALGVREESGRPLLDALVEALQYRSLFVVLDNCEHVVDACAGLAETLLLRCPKVWLLATSREPLAVAGERVYRLPPMGFHSDTATHPDLEQLADTDAVRLFVARARDHRPDFVFDTSNVVAIASVCRHLDGMPLALELAAARMRSMSPEEVERHLGQRFRLLSSRSRTANARQQTLDGAVAWSYDLLNDTEKFVFGTLSVFPATFDLPAAEAVCATAAGLDALDVVDVVDSLVDKSLLQAEQGDAGLRYRMLETIAQYAAERLADLDVAAAARASEAHALYYLGFVESAAPHLAGFEQLEWKAKVETAFDNIRVALTRLVADAGHGIEALRLVSALWTFVWIGGETPGAFHLLAQAALEHPQSQADTTERAKALLTVGYLQQRLGEVDAARSASEAGARVARAIDDASLTAAHLSRLAFELFRLGDYSRARQTVEEALKVANGVDDPNIQASAHERIASILVDDPQVARSHFAEALRLYEHAGNKVRMCATYINLSVLEMEAGDFAAARKSLEAALAHAGASIENEAVVRINLGLVNLLEGKPDLGASQYRDALQQFVRLGRIDQVPYALLGLAVSAGAADDLERAAVLHGAAAAMIESRGTPWEPLETKVRDKAIANLKAQLGEQPFRDAYARGHTMPEPEAIALALA